MLKLDCGSCLIPDKDKLFNKFLIIKRILKKISVYAIMPVGKKDVRSPR